MIDPRTSRFGRLALQSGLINERDLSECWEAIPPDRRDSADQTDRRLARQAIHLNKITLWQAQQLLAGRFNGFKVGRYVLMDLLGQGGMGRVYLAKDTRLGRTVALKILSADRMSNPRAIARFQREGKVGAQLQHENLVRIYDFGEAEERHYLVMEYIEGRTIGSLIAQQGPIPPAIAAGLGRQIALGLEHAYKKGLVHRDVNPFNIMVTYDGTAKLADLGLALDLSDTDRFTRDGATVGTFDYVAPEQARHSHSADIRSDIYSLGCTMYHMIAGEVPFPTASLPEKLYAHQSVEPVPLEKVVPSIPEGLAAGIRRMMKKAPEERFSTPLQVAQMLEPFVEAAVKDQPKEAIVRTREEIRTSPEAKTLMIPRVLPESEKAPETTSNVSSVEPATESSPPAWDLVTALRNAAPVTPPSASASDPDLPLMVDLGPEPSLSEVLAESRKRTRALSVSGTSSGVRSTRDRAVKLGRYLGVLFARPLPAMALLAALLSIGGIVAVWSLVRDSESRSNAELKTPIAEKPQGVVPEIRPSGKLQELAKGEKDSDSILVRSLSGTSPDLPVKTLSEAIRRAIGSGGVVVLRNKEPLELTNKPLIQANLVGKLLIRAEEGCTPVLNINLTAPGPFLSAGPDFRLDLEGLTVHARSTVLPAAPSKGAPKPSTIIQTAGPLGVRKCDFKATSGPVSALFCDGGSLTVDQTRFEGFDRPIEIRMFQYQKAASATINQTVFDPGAGQTNKGWGFKITLFSTKGQAKKTANWRLNLNRCTFHGAGLLALSGFTDQAPLQVTLSDCDLRASSLIDWEPGTNDPGWPENALSWSGEGNYYEIQDDSWVLQKGSLPAEPNKQMSEALKSWSRQIRATALPKASARGADRSMVGPSSMNPGPMN